MNLVPEIRAAAELPYFAREYCWTLESTEDGAFESRFPMLPHLEDFFAAFERRDRIFWEKSRQVLASWACMIAMLHSILFYRNRTFVVISEKEEFVNDRDTTHNCLIGKVKFLIDHLPDIFRRELVVKHMAVSCPRNGSYIKGETANENAGRSGSWYGGLLDEVAHIHLAESIWRALTRACPWGLNLISSPNGMDGLFGRIRWTEAIKNFHLITTYWHAIPGRDRKWYEKACEDLTPWQIASELDILYEKSKEGRVFYPWDRETFTADVAYLLGVDITRSWDMGIGTTAIVHDQVNHIETALGNRLAQLRLFDYYENSGEAAWHYRDIMEAKEREYEGSKIRDIGDPNMIDQRDSGLFTWRINLRSPDSQHPHEVRLVPARCRGVSVENLIENSCKFMKAVETKSGELVPLLQVGKDQHRLIRCIEQYSYPTNREGRVVAKQPKPIKDEFSHASDALQYRAWDLSPMRNVATFRKGDSRRVSGDLPSSTKELEYAYS